MCPLLSWRPAQIWLARRHGLVQPAHGRRVRGGLDDVGVRARLLSNLPHDTDEIVQRLAGLGFRWLDHQRLVYNQREVNGRRVHAKIEYTLGDIKCCNAALFLLALCRSNELVLAYLWIGDLIVRGQFMLEIVCIEDGALCNVEQTIGTIGADVGVCAHQYTEVALVSAYLADGLRTRVLPVVALITLAWQRTWQEGNKVLFDADRARSRATASMRRTARLMQIEMHDVEAHIPRAGDAQDSIGIRAIIVELPTGLVYQGGDLCNIAIKESQRVGIGHHDSGDIGCI